MDFKDILEQWEQSPEGRKAVDDSRFSRILKEKEAGLRSTSEHKGQASAAERAWMKNLPFQDSLDLHGHTSEEAALLIERFISDSMASGYRKVLIVHGKGLHSPDGKGVLKQVVQQCLKNSAHVQSYGKAAPADGGNGAVWVVLARMAGSGNQRSR